MAGKLHDIVHNCKHATLIAVKQESGRVTVTERMRLWIHLLQCDACKNFLKQSALINKAVRQLHDRLFSQPSHQLSNTAKQNLQQQIDDFAA